jgi:rSAM/selenodomain-associated transferase 1
MHVLVMAKEPVPGRVKTRLCPPCTFDDAARLAEAALADTLDAAVGSAASRVVLALDGAPGWWCPPGVDVVAQVEGPLDVRLAAAWEAAGGPGVQIGMDTPQVTPAHLDAAMATLEGHDATLGPADDGGWWLIGLRRPDPRVFVGVPMSCPDTGARQVERIDALGLRSGREPALRDVDHVADAFAAADAAPGTRFAAALASMDLRGVSIGGR